MFVLYIKCDMQVCGSITADGSGHSPIHWPQIDFAAAVPKLIASVACISPLINFPVWLQRESYIKNMEQTLC